MSESKKLFNDFVKSLEDYVKRMKSENINSDHPEYRLMIEVEENLKRYYASKKREENGIHPTNNGHV